MDEYNIIEKLFLATFITLISPILMLGFAFLLMVLISDILVDGELTENIIDRVTDKLEGL